MLEINFRFYSWLVLETFKTFKTPTVLLTYKTFLSVIQEIVWILIKTNTSQNWPKLVFVLSKTSQLTNFKCTRVKVTLTFDKCFKPSLRHVTHVTILEYDSKTCIGTKYDSFSWVNHFNNSRSLFLVIIMH